MTGGSLITSTEWIQIRYFPDCRLFSISAPMCRTALTHRIPSRLVLPVVIAATEREMLFRPYDLASKLESGAYESGGHFCGMQTGVPHVSDIAGKQRICGAPIDPGVVRYFASLTLLSQTCTFAPVWVIIHAIGRV